MWAITVGTMLLRKRIYCHGCFPKERDNERMVGCNGYDYVQLAKNFIVENGQNPKKSYLIAYNFKA